MELIALGFVAIATVAFGIVLTVKLTKAERAELKAIEANNKAVSLINNWKREELARLLAARKVNPYI